MIDSLGIDIIEVKRIKNFMDKWEDRFLLPSPHGGEGKGEGAIVICMNTSASEILSLCIEER
jgi:hypothetical protein